MARWMLNLGAALAIFAAACAHAGSGPTMPQPSGQFIVGTTETDWSHSAAAGERRLKVRIWYPASQRKGGARTYFTKREEASTIDAIERMTESPAGTYSKL